MHDIHYHDGSQSSLRASNKHTVATMSSTTPEPSKNTLKHHREEPVEDAQPHTERVWQEKISPLTPLDEEVTQHSLLSGTKPAREEIRKFNTTNGPSGDTRSDVTHSRGPVPKSPTAKDQDLIVVASETRKSK